MLLFLNMSDRRRQTCLINLITRFTYWQCQPMTLNYMSKVSCWQNTLTNM